MFESLEEVLLEFSTLELELFPLYSIFLVFSDNSESFELILFKSLIISFVSFESPEELPLDNLL